MMDITNINGGSIGSFYPTYETISYSLPMYQVMLNEMDSLYQYEILVLEPGCAESMLSIGLEPKTGPRSTYGEHPCAHSNYVGNMVVIPDELSGYGMTHRCRRQMSGTNLRIDFTTKGFTHKVGTYGNGDLLNMGKVIYPIVGYTIDVPFIIRNMDGAVITYNTLATETYSCYDVWTLGTDHYIAILHHKVADRLNSESVEYIDELQVYVFRYIGTLKLIYCSGWKPFDPSSDCRDWVCNTYKCKFTVTKYTTPDIEGFSLPKSKLEALAKDLISYDVYDEIQVFGDLANAAAQDAKMININTLQYAYELSKISELVSSLTGPLGKLSAKTLSTAYLAYHYGLRLSAKDTNSLVMAVRQSFSKEWDKTWSRIRARSASSYSCGHPCINGGTVSVTNNYKIIYDQLDVGFKSLMKMLDDWDLAIDTSNTWDMLPYTFVVDWFISIGDYLETCENSEYLHNLDVLETTRSRRNEFPQFDMVKFKTILNLKCCIDGDFHLVHYLRLLSPSVIYPRPGIDTNWSNGNHVVEATMLLVQNAH